MQVTIPPKRLSESISSTASSLKLNNIKGWDDVALTVSDLGDPAFAVLRDSSQKQIEIIQIDPTTIGSASITILKRGLSFYEDGTFTEVAANKEQWTARKTIVNLGTNPPQLLADFFQRTATTSQTISSPASVVGDWLYSGSVSSPNSVMNRVTVESLITSLVTGQENVKELESIALEDIGAGIVVYYASLGKIAIADKDNATLQTPGLYFGVTEAAVLSGANLSEGVVLVGETLITGLTPGATIFLGDDGGVTEIEPEDAIILGFADGGGVLQLQGNIIKKNDQDARRGSSGIPSDTNRFVTQQSLDAFSQINKSFTAGESLSAGDAVSLVDTVVGVDNYTTLKGLGSSNSSSFTVGTKGDRVLLVAVSIADSETISSVTYDGDALTFLDNRDSGGVEVALYILVAPSSGSNTLSVTFGGTDLYTIGVWSGFGFEQTASVTVNKATGTGSSASDVNTIEDAGDYLVSFAFADDIATGSETPTTFSAGDNLRLRSQNTIIATGTDDEEYTMAVLDSNGAIFDAAENVTTSVTADNSPPYVFFTVILSREDALTPASIESNTKILKSTTVTQDNFLGFTDEAIADTEEGEVTVIGVKDGFTGLYTGKKYYISDTAGQIDVNPGSVVKKIGLALSTTELLITRD